MRTYSNILAVAVSLLSFACGSGASIEADSDSEASASAASVPATLAKLNRVSGTFGAFKSTQVPGVEVSLAGGGAPVIVNLSPALASGIPLSTLSGQQAAFLSATSGGQSNVVAFEFKNDSSRYGTDVWTNTIDGRSRSFGVKVVQNVYFQYEESTACQGTSDFCHVNYKTPKASRSYRVARNLMSQFVPYFQQFASSDKSVDVYTLNEGETFTGTELVGLQISPNEVVMNSKVLGLSQ